MGLGNAERRLRLVVEYEGASVRSGAAESAAHLRELAVSAGRIESDRAEELASSLDRVSGAGRGATSVLGQVNGQITKMAGRLDAMGLAQTAIQFADLGNKSLRAEQGLMAYSGSAAAAARNAEAVSRATGGMLSDFQATQQASFLLSMGMASNARELENFTDIAVTLGAARGKGAAESIEGLALAVANISYDRLDGLGLSAGEVRKRVMELKEEGLATEEAFRLATLEIGTENLRKLEAAGFDATDGINQVRAAIENLKTSGGEDLAVQMDGAATALAGLLRAVNGVQEADVAMGLGQTFAQVGNALRDLAPVMLDVAQGSATMRDVLMPAADNIGLVGVAGDAALTSLRGLDAGLLAVGVDSDYLAGRIDYLASIFDVGAESARHYDEALLASRGSFYDVDAAAKVASEGLADAETAARKQAAAALAARQANFLLKDSLDALGNARTGNYGMGAPAARPGDTLRLKDALDRRDVARSGRANDHMVTASELSGVKGESQAYWQEFWNPYEEQGRGAARRTGSALTGAHRDAAREAERLAAESRRAYEREMGQIEGAVRRSLDLSGGIGRNDDLLDRFGLRMEGPGEIIRRLQDVVNRGGESQWANFYAEALGITDATGDEVKARAAALMQDIQDGLRPDLIDRDALLARARREIEGQRQLEALYKDAAKQLHGEGFGSKEIEEALGASLGPAAAASGGTAGVDLTAALMQATRAQLDASQEEIKGLGRLFMAGLLQGAREAGAEPGIVGPLIVAVREEVLAELEDALDTSDQ